MTARRTDFRLPENPYNPRAKTAGNTIVIAARDNTNMMAPPAEGG